MIENGTLKDKNDNSEIYFQDEDGVMHLITDFSFDDNGELVEFICDCGCSSQAASKYCPDCGTKMDNSDIEERIQEAIHKAI